MGLLATECLLEAGGGGGGGSRQGDRAAVQPDCLFPGQDDWVGAGVLPCLRQVPEMTRGECEAQ